MYEKFEKLNMEKKIRIIDAAIKEFGTQGYSNASTNEIVKRAGISKGALFNYFNSKKGLYIYLFDYCIKLLEDKLHNHLSFSEEDFLLRLQELTIAKMELFKDNPDIYYFLVNFQSNIPDSVKKELDELSEVARENNMSRLFENIDYSKFKDDIDIQKTLQIINWTLVSFSEEIMERIKCQKHSMEDMDKYFKDIEGYIEVFRKTFYKN